MSLDEKILETFDRSLARCVATGKFVDLFYERFLAASPRVQAKFEGTDFERQKRALRASLHMMLLAAQDEADRLDHHLGFLARRHGSSQLDIGPEMYELWLDSLLATVREIDPECGPEVEDAWKQVMRIGIRYMIDHYDDPPPSQDA